MLQLTRGNGKPLGDQIVENFSAMIRHGNLAEGTRLPSVRQLAQRLSVSVHTVVTAYDRLASKGLIESRAGKGCYVSRQPHRSDFPQIEVVVPSPATALGFAQSSLDTDHPAFPASSGFLPGDWFADALSPTAAARLVKPEAAAMQPAPVQGTTVLRDLLSDGLRRKGIPAQAGNLLVTYGASQAFDLIIRAGLVFGDSVLVEDPGYFVLHSQLERAGIRLVPIPRNADGPDTEAVDEMARLHRPRAFFMQTLLQNPTGGNASPANCHKLLSLAEQHNFLIVEDDVYGDLASPHMLRLAQIDELQRVLYVGSFTKLLNPGMRVGYIAAPAALVPRLAEQKMLSVLSGSTLLEMLVADTLESGRYRKHADQLRQRLARARAHAVRILPELGIKFEEGPQDGIFLWGRVPRDVDTDRLASDAQQNGILLAKGTMFSPTGGSRDFIRLNAAYCTDPRFTDYLKTTISRRAEFSV